MQSTQDRSINDGSLPSFTIAGKASDPGGYVWSHSCASRGRTTLARAIHLRHIVFLIGAYRQSEVAAKVARPVRLIDRELAHHVGLVLAQDSTMKQYIVEFAHPTGPLSLIAASVRAPTIESAIRIVHDRLREIVAEQSPPKVTECSAEIDEATVSMLCSAFRTVTDNDQEKLAVLISALDQYSTGLATRIRELLNANN